MNDAPITSRHNQLVKHARLVRDGKEQEQIFIEGVRLAEEALRSGLKVQGALYTEKVGSDERGSQLLHQLKAQGCRLSPVSEEVLASISDTRTPQGVVLLAARPRTGASLLTARAKTEGAGMEGSGPLLRESAVKSEDTELQLFVIIHGINNPANAGAILRAAEAAGATGLIATAGSTDLFSPKALRGAMGSAFRLPLWTGADFNEALRWCRQSGLRTIGSTLSAAKSHTEADWTSPCALVLGSEASGLKSFEVEMLDDAIRIPMRAPVESLNVAVASGIILYEAARQRREGRRN
jgi:TrmH family RNA methyltransferase